MTNRVGFIKELIEKEPEQYLRTITVRIDNKVRHIGLFQCEVCGKPIADSQYNFARCCASCDTNQDEEDWLIEKPGPQEFERFTELSSDEITEKLAEYTDMTPEELEKQSEKFDISSPWESEIEYKNRRY